MSITFWQVALVFLLTRNVLTAWLNNGKDVEYTASNYMSITSIYLIVFYMQGFFYSFGWPQYVLATVYGLVFIIVLANLVSKEKFIKKFTSKVSFYKVSFGSFQMATIAYYGGFFNGVTI